MLELISLFLQGVIALSSLTLVGQIYMFRRAGKYENCRRLHDIIGNSEEMTKFHGVLKEADLGREMARNLFTVLNDPSSRDVDRYREGAESYARFLKYLFYIIRERLVEPSDAAEIVGELIVEYYRMGERMRVEGKMSSEAQQKYFPVVPSSLRRELKRRRVEGWLGVFQD